MCFVGSFRTEFAIDPSRSRDSLAYPAISHMLFSERPMRPHSALFPSSNDASSFLDSQPCPSRVLQPSRDASPNRTHIGHETDPSVCTRPLFPAEPTPLCPSGKARNWKSCRPLEFTDLHADPCRSRRASSALERFTRTSKQLAGDSKSSVSYSARRVLRPAAFPGRGVPHIYSSR